jgi:hypothetical protein
MTAKTGGNCVLNVSASRQPVLPHRSPARGGSERDEHATGKEQGGQTLEYRRNSPEINELLLRINRLVQARALLRKSGGRPDEIQAKSAEIARLQWRLADAVRSYPPNRDAAA